MDENFSDVDLRDNSIYVLPSSAASGDEPFPAPPSSESIYRDDGLSALLCTKTKETWLI